MAVCSVVYTGALAEIRTRNQQLRRLVLCPLSYEGLIQLYYVLAKQANLPPDRFLAAHWPDSLVHSGACQCPQDRHGRAVKTGT
jgi:hypothetical protein